MKLSLTVEADTVNILALNMGRIAVDIQERWQRDEWGVPCPMPSQVSQRKPDGNGILDGILKISTKEKTQAV